MAQIMNSLLQTSFKFSSVAQSLTELSWLSSVKEPTLSDPMGYSMPGFPITNSQSLLKLMSIESVIPCNHFFLCCPLLLLPSIFPTISESAVHIRWPQYWSFSISPSSEYSELISFMKSHYFSFFIHPHTLLEMISHTFSFILKPQRLLISQLILSS